MGPPLKGKKAWRKNIDASEVERYLEDASHQERRGPAVETLADSELFFVDKAADTEGAQQLALGASRRKPRLTKLQLRSTAILEQAHRAQPVVPHKTVRKVGAVLKKEAPEVKRQRRPRFTPVAVNELDIWGSAPLATATATTSAPALHETVLPEHPAAALGAAAARARRKLRKTVLPSKVQAVDVDMAGCSYNPDEEAHQDALAVLVASEMKKVLKEEFQRKAPSRKLDATPEDITLDDIARLQVEAPGGDDDADEARSGDGAGAASARSKSDKKTKQERNRGKRRTAQEKEAEERQRLKRQRRELEQLEQLEQELEQLQAEQELRRQRRQAVKNEKASLLPGKLGKHKFEPASLQVATSNELGGSLRRVKPCSTVALHRYKSLQQRGLIEPRKVVLAKKGKRVEYEKGLRTERALAGQAEIEAMQKARKILAKEAKKAKKAGAHGEEA